MTVDSTTWIFLRYHLLHRLLISSGNNNKDDRITIPKYTKTLQQSNSPSWLKPHYSTLPARRPTGGCHVNRRPRVYPRRPRTRSFAPLFLRARSGVLLRATRRGKPGARVFPAARGARSGRGAAGGRSDVAGATGAAGCWRIVAATAAAPPSGGRGHTWPGRERLSGDAAARATPTTRGAGGPRGEKRNWKPARASGIKRRPRGGSAGFAAKGRAQAGWRR